MNDTVIKIESTDDSNEKISLNKQKPHFLPTTFVIVEMADPIANRDIKVEPQVLENIDSEMLDLPGEKKNCDGVRDKRSGNNTFHEELYEYKLQKLNCLKRKKKSRKRKTTDEDTIDTSEEITSTQVLETSPTLSDNKDNEHTNMSMEMYDSEEGTKEADENVPSEYVDEYTKNSNEDFTPKTKVHPCELCPKVYKTSFGLKTHIRTHTGEKPFKCKKCGKEFVRSSNLNAHFLYLHTNDRPFTCKICDKGFITKSVLNVHYRTHETEKPFRCMACLKDFKYIRRYKQHVVFAHSDVKPYSCDICKKVFASNDSKKRHIRMHAKKNAVDIEKLNLKESTENKEKPELQSNLCIEQSDSNSD